MYRRRGATTWLSRFQLPHSSFRHLPRHNDEWVTTKNLLTRVGVEPTPPYSDEKPDKIRQTMGFYTLSLESHALDRSAILPCKFEGKLNTWPPIGNVLSILRNIPESVTVVDQKNPSASPVASSIFSSRHTTFRRTSGIPQLLTRSSKALTLSESRYVMERLCPAFVCVCDPSGSSSPRNRSILIASLQAPVTQLKKPPHIVEESDDCAV